MGAGSLGWVGIPVLLCILFRRQVGARGESFVARETVALTVLPSPLRVGDGVADSISK